MASSGTAPAPLPKVAWLPVGVAALGAVAVLLLTSTRYGYHRDELYFVEASKHLAWGYVDQPPFSIVMVGLSRVLFGDSLVGLRLFPALADGLAVLMTGFIAREVGGNRFAQGLAALGLAIGPFLIAGHLAGPTIYDFAAWTVTSWLVIRILRAGDERLWVLVGLIVGVALLNKETIGFLLIALGVGLLVNRQASVFRSPWLWAGAGVALVIWSPNLVWQAQHHWPSIEMSRNLRREHSGLGPSFSFIVIQLLLPGWWIAPVWIAGLWALWRQQRFRPYRSFAVAYAFLFVLIGVFIGDRPYYFAALYAVLVGPGAIVTEGVALGGRRFLSERARRRRLIWRSRRAAVLFVLVLGVINLPLSLPFLPAKVLATVPLQALNYNLGESIGWQELVAIVSSVDRSLTASQRAQVAIVTENYGEAGAIDRYGPALGLPQAYSGHNSYWSWGPPKPATGITIAVGFFDASALRPYFSHVTLAARIRNPQGVENDEQGGVVWLCWAQRAPWPAIWPDFRHFG
jgi:4-amino-4-deoxy-L-arabinose transferase-like glycosyltransferase